MKIVYKKPSELKAADYNPRQLSDLQFEQLKKSLEGFDVVEPIVINTFKGRENIIVGGHQRVKVLESMGVKTIPCVEVSLPFEKEKELNVRLNKNTGQFDFDMLANNFEIEDLLEWGFTEDELSFSTEVVEGLTDEDAVPSAPENPKTVLGDVWVLGNHRLMCGDSTSIDAVEKLMDGQKADMVFTDPPYGMSYGGGRAKGNHARNKRGGGAY
jgi:ParB family chromosome partitioning protein